MSLKLRGGWDKPAVESAVPAASKNEEFPFRAPHICSLALRRGFYFSLRLPDWARDFKQQTREILGHRFDPLKRDLGERPILSSLKQSKHYGDARSERYDMTFSESPFFEGVSRQKAKGVERLPKIKDDLTCGKRFASAQKPLP